ncbi:hypothetical protein GCM10009557_36630 [Virgisporangium ochraceum]|uniref:NAD(P)-binding domain-containing protein n=1 Tax=Virgisporangium ochraceum TaxID=65505 RepID=A0A8J3ZWG4_9ACTN|nr:NAD(P)H-binding protein [Virgisporangium ochraceum]GIJ70891.1 hypothetical protein Voc01_058080 [Virgisporangium ochraceum]
MKLTILAATGGVGRHLLRQAVAAGHDVTVVVRTRRGTLMEDVLRDSDLDWTVSRPPRLLEVRLCRGYRTAVGRNVRGGAFIARADVAHHMLAVLDRPETFHRDIGIAY